MESKTETAEVQKSIREEFKISYNEEQNDDIDDYESILEKDIETTCDFGGYIDELKIEEKNDDELYKLDKKEIIDFKNYQIQKLKAYINSLEKEKEDLIENYKITTNVLLDKIKEIEYNNFGQRPQTANIMQEIHKTTNEIKHDNKNNISTISTMNNTSNTVNSNSSGGSGSNIGGKSQVKISGSGSGSDINLNINFNNQGGKGSSYDQQIFITPFTEKNKMLRCANCKKEFMQEVFTEHSLQCLRYERSCKVCKEMVPEDKTTEHLNMWRDTKKILEAINAIRPDLLSLCLDHGADANSIINTKTGDSILTTVAAIDERFINIMISQKSINLDHRNKNNESALIIALDNRKTKIARILIDRGANLEIKNKEEHTALMICCKKGIKDIAEILLKKGVSQTANILGETPVKLAQQNGNEELSLLMITKYKATLRPMSKNQKIRP